MHKFNIMLPKFSEYIFMIIYKFHFKGTYNDFFIELNSLLMIPIVTACFGEHILRSKESSQGNFKRVETFFTNFFISSQYSHMGLFLQIK